MRKYSRLKVSYQEDTVMQLMINAVENFVNKGTAEPSYTVNDGCISFKALDDRDVINFELEYSEADNTFYLYGFPYSGKELRNYWSYEKMVSLYS